MVTQADETPILIGQAGPLNGQQWEITNDLVVGRDNLCDILISDRQVSRHHARISLRNDGYFLEDLGSKNGTHVNGNQIDGGVFLENGDIVQIALVQEIIYISAESTIPLIISNIVADKQKCLHLDKNSRQVWVRGKEVLPPLSLAQFRVLEILINEDGKVVSKDKLKHAIWGEDASTKVSAQAIEALIRRLRIRLAELDHKQDYITTVRGHGLRLENPDQ